jgi:hypothetical protein
MMLREQEIHLLFRTWLFSVFLCMMELPLDSATHHSFTSKIEMNGDLNAILAMMKGDKTYRELFKALY